MFMGESPNTNASSHGALPGAPRCPSCLAATGVSRRRLLAEGGCYECASCGMVFFFPIPKNASPSSGPHSVMTTEAYTEGMIAASKAGSATKRCHDMARRRPEQSSRMLGRPQYSLLEVGCGTADLGPHFLQLGVDYNGIDIDERCIAAAREKGLSSAVRCMDFFDLDSTNTFDVVSFSQVLEHMSSPRRFIEHVHQRIVAGGVVQGDVPNHAGLASVMSRLGVDMGATRWGAIEYPHHLFAYRRRPLARLLESCFEVNVFATISSDACWGQPRAMEGGLSRRHTSRLPRFWACPISWCSSGGGATVALLPNNGTRGTALHAAADAVDVRRQFLGFWEAEPPRFSRRLQPLRGWSHGHIKEVST